MLSWEGQAHRVYWWVWDGADRGPVNGGYVIEIKGTSLSLARSGVFLFPR